MRDRVHGTGFGYDCRIGFHEYELGIRQRVLVDFEAETDWRRVAQQDVPEGLVDYFEVHRALQRRLEGRSYRLIEAMAEDAARLICQNFPVSRVRVKVTKQPINVPNIGLVAVECWRTPSDFAEPSPPEPR